MRSPIPVGPIISALLGLAAAAEARESANSLSGIFSNVQQSADTGDLGGLEIEIDADAPQPFAVVVFCEGWCSQAHRVPVRLNGKEFELAFAEPYYDESGKFAGADGYRLHGYLSGETLIAELRSDRLQAESWRETFRLKRQTMRFGLEVATAPKDRP